PPVGVGVAVSRRQVAFVRFAGRVGTGALDGQVAGTQLVARGQRDLDVVAAVADFVIEPVVHHELDPGRRNEVHGGGRLELVATGHQLVTDFTRVRGQQRVGIDFCLHGFEADVAAHAHPGRTFCRVRQDVTGAVLGPRRQAAFVTYY